MPQLRLHKPSAILFDINGTTANTSFVDRILIVYFKRNVKAFIINNWEHEQVQRDIKMLRKESAKNSSLPKISPDEGNPAAIQEDVEKLCNHCADHDIDFLALAQLRFHVWFDGYEKGLIVTPIYSDVAIQMQKWRCDEEIKLYVVSQGWSEANKVFMSRTNQGDMGLLIDDYFDTSMGPLGESETFKKILEKVGANDNVIFFTKSGWAASAASGAGIFPILVMTHKKSYDMLNEEEKSMAIIRTMNEVEFEEVESKQ